MKTSYWSFIVTLAFSITLFSSCEEDPMPAPSAAPEIPPTEMFSIPTAVMDHSSTDTTSSHATYHNWVHAGINLVVWNTIIVANISIPTAAFARALDENPVYIGNGIFEWSYQYVAPPILGEETYDISLTGEYINNGQDVRWIMTASQVGGFTNFEWYRGIVATNHTEGNFTVNHQPNNPAPYISIDYLGDPSTSDESIRYTNINPSSNEIGGYIEYRVEPGNSFNRAFDVNGGPNNPGSFLEIQWLDPTMEGRVKNPDHFNDTDWHCWDTNREDTAC